MNRISPRSSSSKDLYSNGLQGLLPKSSIEITGTSKHSQLFRIRLDEGWCDVAVEEQLIHVQEQRGRSSPDPTSITRDGGWSNKSVA